VQFKDVGKIEKQNLINFNIFVMIFDDGRLFPIKISEEKYHDHMELLHIKMSILKISTV